MKISTVVFAFLACLAVHAEAPALACNLKAISQADRPRYNDLEKRLGTAVRNKSELPDGYGWTLDGKAVSLAEAAEWISLERLCCPFLTFQLSASGNQSDWGLKMTGPQGAKAVLQGEFPAHLTKKD